MKNKECYIIQDFLPNYIDRLTSDETNKYIENHISKCKECSNVLNNMRNDSIIEENNSKKYINFARKYNIKFNILKVIVILIIFILSITIVRKVIIINKLSVAAKSYENITNYYSKYYQYTNSYITIIESYNKDGKNLRKLKNIEKQTGKIIDITIEYYDGNTLNRYTESLNGKFATLDSDINVVMPIELKNYNLCFENILSFTKTLIFSNIKNVDCNGIKCYRITDLYSINQLNSKDEEYIYIDKSTGLLVRVFGGINIDKDGTYNCINDYYYEINTVTDDDLIEPNVEEYIVVSK